MKKRNLKKVEGWWGGAENKEGKFQLFEQNKISLLVLFQNCVEVINEGAYN